MTDHFSRHGPHGKVWRIAGPMILSNLTVPLLGIVDTAVVGHLGQPHHMGAVSVGAAIFGIVFWGFGFLRMGTTGITAQAYGENDNDELRATLARALLIAGVIALLIILLQSPVAWVAFQVIQGSDQVEQYGRLYFDIRIWSAPATFMNYVLLGWFLGMQNARAPLYLLTFVNLINMLLDFLFVMGLGYGASGVAWASLIAEYFGLGLALWMAIALLKLHPGELWQARVFDKQKVRKLIAINKDIFVRNLCLMFTLGFFTAQGARFGDTVLAANAILFNMQTFMAYALDGFAHAAEALVGKAVGARDRDAYFAAIKTSALWAVVTCLLIAGVYWLLGNWVIALMTDIDPVRQTALMYLPWVVLLPLISVWSFMFDGVYVGTTRSAEMRNTMLFSTVFIFLPAWYLLLPLRNHGLWLAFVLFMTARAISMAVLMRRVSARAGFHI
ncbi:MAG: MATE family efflux transporter [Gammaproteobacteria bacterium]|jgi:MATE family multidrug resistance protein